MITNYGKAAEEAVENAKLYIKEDGISTVISYPVKIGGILRAYKVDFYDY